MDANIYKYFLKKNYLKLKVNIKMRKFWNYNYQVFKYWVR